MREPEPITRTEAEQFVRTHTERLEWLVRTSHADRVRAGFQSLLSTSGNLIEDIDQAMDREARRVAERVVRRLLGTDQQEKERRAQAISDLSLGGAYVVVHPTCEQQVPQELRRIAGHAVILSEYAPKGEVLIVSHGQGIQW